MNILNISAAIEVAKIFKVPQSKIKAVILNFKGLPHRLEFVGKFNGIYFYNDSLATIPEATIGALKALKDKVQTLILGGWDCNLCFKNLAKEILRKKIENLIFFPETGKKIFDEISRLKKNLKLKAFFV
ncbi:MAG: hypothetical protein ACK4UJ_12675, partial [Leptonema sp. (in: bacteria)]